MTERVAPGTESTRIRVGRLLPSWVLLKAIHARGGLLPASVHMYTRRHVAAEKGIVEAIPALAIVGSFAYLLPANLA